MSDTRQCARPNCPAIIERGNRLACHWHTIRYCCQRCRIMAKRADGGAGGELSAEERHARMVNGGRSQALAGIISHRTAWGMDRDGCFDCHETLGWIPQSRWLAERYAGRRYNG